MVLLSFLKDLAGSDTSDKYALVKAVESVWNPKCIFPLAFSENVAAHSLTNIKSASNISGVGGGSSYESIHK